MGLDPGKGVEAGKDATAKPQSSVGKKRTSSSKDEITLGAKGQKLPAGVLPDGTHEVGPINERAMGNKEKAIKWEAQAEENLAEAREKGEQLAEQGLNAETVLDKRQGPLSKPGLTYGSRA